MSFLDGHALTWAAVSPDVPLSQSVSGRHLSRYWSLDLTMALAGNIQNIGSDLLRVKASIARLRKASRTLPLYSI